jgi:hypothetical protein
MKINQYLSEFDSRNSFRTFLFSNSKFNQTSMTPSYKTINPSLKSSINTSKTNFNSFKQRKEYINYTSSRNNFDKINKRNNNLNNLKTNFTTESNKLTIINNSKMNKPLSMSITNNSWKNNFQFEKQNSIFFNSGTIKLKIEKLNDNQKFYNTDKIQQPYKIKNEHFSLTNKFNNENSKIDESFSDENEKEKPFKNIFPISKRIRFLKRIKMNIDKTSENNSKGILNKSPSNSSINSNITNKKNSKMSIFDEVFTTNNETQRNINFQKIINIPNLLRTNSKKKQKIPTYAKFMKENN